MRTLLQLGVFILLAFVCGALLTYPVYLLLNPLTDIPFNKLISHITSFTGLVFIFLFLKFNGILDRQTAGFSFRSGNTGKSVLSGLVFGMLIMFVLECMLYASGVHIPEPELSLSTQFMLVLILKAVLSGLAVALIEETIYRGALLGGLIRTNGVITAVMVSSVIYSAVHFLGFPAVDDPESINIFTGLQMLPHIFGDFTDAKLLDAFLALVAFGVLLALARIYTGNVIACMGIHAGVIIAIRFIKEFTDYNFNTAFPFLVSAYDHLLGFLALAWLLILIVLMYVTRNRLQK